MNVIVVWMKEDENPSVIGPYEDVDLAAEDGRLLERRGAVKTALCQISHPSTVLALS